MDLSGVSRRQLLGAAGVYATGVAGCLSTGPDEPVAFIEGFEDGLGDWVADADVPEDPNTSGRPVEWAIEPTADRAASGSASLRFSLDGRQDDGTIWVVRPVTVEVDRAYEVRMDVSAWSASESFNTLAHLVIYAGTHRPTAEDSFPAPGETSSGAGETDVGGLREPLNQVEGWTDYGFDWETPVLVADRLFVAVGISAVWETELTYFVDDIAFTAMPG